VLAAGKVRFPHVLHSTRVQVQLSWQGDQQSSVISFDGIKLLNTVGTLAAICVVKAASPCCAIIVT
jgi:hypothetical protein